MFVSKLCFYGCCHPCFSFFTLFPLKFIEGKAKSVSSPLFTFFPLSPYIMSESLRSQCLRESEGFFPLIWFDTSDSIAHTLQHTHTHTHTLFNTPSPTYVFKLMAHFELCALILNFDNFPKSSLLHPETLPSLFKKI